MPDTLKNRALTTYEQMILPYKKQLEEKELLIEQERKRANQERERARERVRQEQEKVRHKNREFIKIALQLNLPMAQIIEFTQLTEVEINRVIALIKRENK